MRYSGVDWAGAAVGLDGRLGKAFVHARAVSGANEGDSCERAFVHLPLTYLTYA